MSKPIKDIISKELSSRFGKLDSIMVVNPIGLNAIDTNKLRIALRAKKIEIEVVKNAMAQRAFVGTKLESIGGLLSGPSALVSGGDSIVEVAREVLALVKKYTKLEVRGAIVEGQVLDAKGADMLSKMPNRKELQGQVVMLAQSPGARVAGQITAPAARIAGCVKALAEKLEKQAGSQAA